MRTRSSIVIAALLGLGCAEPEQGARAKAEAKAGAPRDSSAATAATDPTTANVGATGTTSPVALLGDPPSSPGGVDPSLEPALDSGTNPLDPAKSMPDADLEPADPLAPVMPSGPEPGSPEADAELDALLEESTLTQEEFDAAFRSNKPKIEGDQFVFGPGDRTRKTPVVRVGTPTVTNSKVAPAKISALASTALRGFESCLAVALTDQPTTNGSASVQVVFDAQGKAGKVSAGLSPGTSAGTTGASLQSCLVAVADDWRLGEAAGATVVVPLSLASE